jgi:hypothetical protein
LKAKSARSTAKNAYKHGSYLGYKPGFADLRFFYHRSDSRKNTDSGHKENGLNWQPIEKYQADGRGVGVAVNGACGGHADADIKHCCAIFCKWDDLSLGNQFENNLTLDLLNQRSPYLAEVDAALHTLKRYSSFIPLFV